MSDDTKLDMRGEPEPSWPGSALPRGTVVNGYRIDRVLGSGGFGITYLAFDLLQQPFAIKEYYPRQFATRQNMTVRPSTEADAALFDECRERFLREAQALVLLGRAAGANEGIVRVLTYFESFGTCFLVMDYVEGDSLANVFRREPGGLSPERMRSLMTQLLSSIRVVHRAGLMHRDIKPTNVILRESDRLVLIDFGSTRQAAFSDAATTFTQIYSGGYGPPEQMLGQRQGEFSDIYAIGAVCYRAIGGRMADALARQNSLAAGMPDPQPSAASVGAGRYPASLLAAIDAALQVDPKRRPQSADAMLGLLEADESVRVPPALAEHRLATVVVPRARPVTRPAAPRTLEVAWRAWLVAALAWGGRRFAAARAWSGEWLATPRTWNLTWLAAAAGIVVVAGGAYFALRGSGNPPPAAVSEPPTMAAAPEQTPAPPTLAPAPDQTPVPLTPTPPVTLTPALPPIQMPQTEAVITPLAPDTPTIPAVPSRLLGAEDTIKSLPCAALRLAAEGDGMRVLGFAPAGAELDRALADIRGIGRVSDRVTRVDRFACSVLEVLAGTLRRTGDGAPPLAIRVDPPNVAIGGRGGITIATALPVLYVDLFQPDGLVRHLLAPFPSGTSPRRTVEWLATPPPGPRIVVAIGTASPLPLGPRPERERGADYLEALRSLLEGATTPIAADLAMVIVRPPEPVVARQPQSHPTSGRNEKCANIVTRAQLGETLSDADLAALRTECRS